MTDKPADEIERRAKEAASKFNWSGVVNRLRTGNYAFKLGWLSGHSAAKEEVEEVKSNSTAVIRGLEKTIRTLEAENAELKSNYWYRKAKGLATVADENKEIYRQLDALKKENEEIKFNDECYEMIQAENKTLKTAQKDLMFVLADWLEINKGAVCRAIDLDGLIRRTSDLLARHRKAWLVGVESISRGVSKEEIVSRIRSNAGVKGAESFLLELADVIEREGIK